MAESGGRYIEIRNWEKFQHKDVWRKSGGRPPWIKNYTRLLHDDEYMALTWAQRGILHGLWLMYASTGQAVSENRARTVLAHSGGEARHFQAHLESLNHAGFITFVSQHNRVPLATRREERREEKPLEEPDKKPGAGWVENLSSYTGCRYVRGTHSLTAVHDVLGTETPPNNWPHKRPTRNEIRAALKQRKEANGGNAAMGGNVVVDEIPAETAQLHSAP